MNKKLLPYEIAPHEIGFLILLAAGFYYADARFYQSVWPVYLFGAAVVAAVIVLIGRCREEWRQMPNRWFFISLAAVWVALFAFLGNPTVNYLDSPSLFKSLFVIYVANESEDAHGLLIPFVVMALFWWKRKELVAGPLRLWWPALGLIGFALLLHYVGFKAQQMRLSVAGFFLGVYGLTGLAWGWHWIKHSFFPFFLLAFCMPVGDYAGPLTMPLRLLVSRIVEMIAHLGLAPDLIRQGTELFDGDHTFAYEVAAACSGIHSLVALIALTTIYGFVVFRSPWKRLTMLLIALPLAVLGNVVRLCFTIGVAETFGQAAGKAVETKFGFLTFGVAVVCAFLIAHWLEHFGETKLAAPALANKPATP